MAVELIVRGGVALVDEERLQELSSYNWYLRKDGYIRADIGRRGFVYMHRLVFGPTSVMVDHKNRNKQDNRKENLREGNDRLNALNNGKQPKGYYYKEARGTWVVRFTVNRKQKYFGECSTEERAQQRAKEVYADLLKEAGVES